MELSRCEVLSDQRRTGGRARRCREDPPGPFVRLGSLSRFGSLNPRGLGLGSEGKGKTVACADTARKGVAQRGED